MEPPAKPKGRAATSVFVQVALEHLGQGSRSGDRGVDPDHDQAALTPVRWQAVLAEVFAELGRRRLLVVFGARRTDAGS